MPRARKDGTPARAPNRTRLNIRLVDTVQPAERRVLIWDTVQRGLALVVSKMGRRSYKYTDARAVVSRQRA